MRRNLAKSKVKILKKKLINTAFLLIFSVIAVVTYYTANFSKAKDIIEINVEIKNALDMTKSASLDVNTTEGSNGDTFYIKLPQYLDNKKVVKYSYYTAETSTQNTSDTENTVKTETKKETDKTTIDEIGPNDVLPESKIYLTTSEIREKRLTIIAHYDTKEVNGIAYYNKLLTEQKNDTTITASGYMPENSELKITDVDLKSVQSQIRKKTTKPVILAVAYDIKIQSDGKEYEPYQIDQSVNINIEKDSLKDKDVNVWHIKEDNQIEKIEDNTTKSFSIFGLEDAEATALAIDGMAESVLTIDDADSDKYYWMGQNYTDDATGTNKNTYTSFANITLNYHAYANDETDPEKIGYVSLTERYNVITYKKTIPIINGNISIELVDNPFNDRPTGYGFGGWRSTDGTITKDSKTNTQTITLTGSNNITINVYTNWTEAKVVYLNPDTGNDNLNSGLTTDEPFGSWGAAFNYLYNNSSNRSERENNIIVLTGNIDSSPNYTRDVKVTSQVKKGDVYYARQNSITNGDTYIIAMGMNSSSYALMGDGGAESGQLSSTTIPNDYYMWKFISNGSSWEIQNVKTRQYLVVNTSSQRLELSSTATNWTYSNGTLYTTVRNGWWGSTTYYLSYNSGGNYWTYNSYSGTTIYLLKADFSEEDKIVIEKGQDIQNNNNYTSNKNVAVTITSLYDHTDYRDSAIMDLTQNNYQDINLYADMQLEYVNVNATGYKTACSSQGTSISSNYPIFYGRANNFRIGRGMKLANTSNDAAVAGSVIGGFSSGTTVGSSSNSNNAYKLVIESGKYSSLLGWNVYGKTSSYYGTVYWTLGSDIDRALNDNNKLSSYFRNTVNAGGGINGKSNIRDKAYLINVKSGIFGVDAANDGYGDAYTSGIYMGGYGTGTSNSTRDISDRYMIVEGGVIYNINCGLKVASNSTAVLTKLYVKGGEIYNIVGGAGQSTTYGSRILQITGGKVRYSVSGGSNGYTTSTEGQISNCNTLVYVGGNAQIGDETLVGYITDDDTSNDNNGKLYYVEAGCVLGAGNGRSGASSAGQVDNTHIIIADNAHILNSVYGGGNYGIVGSTGSTSATAIIEILGGTIDRNVYGGSNTSSIYGSTQVKVKGGQVKGAVYGGSNTSGTISSTTTVTVTGGKLGVEGNTTDDPVLFGGGYGSSTTVSGNATVTIRPDNDINIYGSCYGGSSLGKMNSNVTVTINDIPKGAEGATAGDTSAKANIVGYVFAGGKGNTNTAATIAGNATLEVNGSELPECRVFGGNDINGTTSGTITVNIGQKYKSTLLGVYGGGNKASITTATKGVYVNLLQNADVEYAFNGGMAADLQSSGTTDTTRAIYLQGGYAKNIFGGSDSSGTVTASHVYIQSGTATNVFGGNDIGGVTNTSNVSVTGGTVENVYGGGYQATTTASNVSLTGGTVTNGFGGGNAANVTNSSITLAGSNTSNIYGGSNQQGTVTKSYVNINSGIVENVYGGNNAGGNTIDTEVIVNSSVTNVYGGGNEAQTTGNTNVKLSNANITGSAYGGGNGAAAIVLGNSIIKVEGTTQIAGDLFGGGNAAANGSQSKDSLVQVLITGGIINGDVYGAANTSVVNGQTQVKVGSTAVNDTSLIKGSILISGTVFGGGKSNSAGSENYDFTFESVTGDVNIDINADGYDNGTYTFAIKGSIFGSGNAAKISGKGYVNVSNYGTATNLKENISIQRATQVVLNKCGMYLTGTTDRTNELATAIYTFNRINNLIVKNNTTLYLASGVNIVEKFTSVDASDNKATVTIGNDGITSQNVDNRIYLSQGKNMILRTEDGAHGEVKGMTYVGIYKGTINRTTGIYGAGYKHGDTIPDDIEDFARNSYVQGKHYDTHDITVDGFYTNYNEGGVINTKYITPTPEKGAFYQWIVGKTSDDIYYDNIELIATKYATTSTHVLELTGLNNPNMILEVVGFDTSDLKEGVTLTNQSDIPNIEMDPDKANSRFSLTMTAGNTGWQTNGTTNFYTDENKKDTGTYNGTTQYLSENSNNTPNFSLYMASSKNISKTENLGTVTIKLQAKYKKDNIDEEMIIRNVYIVLTLSTNNTIKLATDYYEGAITPGKKYSMFPTTNTNITSKSSLSTYYSLYLGNYSTDPDYYYEADSTTGMVGYKHCLISSCVLPVNTKITMVDSSLDDKKYYYYIVSAEDEANGKKEFYFTEFTNMGSTDEKYNSDLAYYHKDLDIVLEQYIFQVDFEDITLANSLEKQTLIVQLRDEWDSTMKLTVNIDQYPMMYNLFSDKEAIKSVDANASKTFIYMGDSFNVNLSTGYTFQTQNSEIVYDTTHFEDQLGVKITVLDSSTPLTSQQLTGIYIEHNGNKYYARADGSYRIKIADAVSNVLTDMVFKTENGTLSTSTYTFKFETFGSLDGVYYSSTIATDSINMQIINADYGLSAELDDNSVLIDKTTGFTKNNDNVLDFAIGYQAEFENPRISVSLYRRKYDTIYDSEYVLTDLAEYVTNTLIKTKIDKEYSVTDNAQTTQNYILNLKENLITGTYKIVFSLYDGDNYIGNVEKMIIIK